MRIKPLASKRYNTKLPSVDGTDGSEELMEILRQAQDDIISTSSAHN